MTLPIILRPQAEVDLREASDWYDQQRPGLGEEFEEATAEIFAQVEAMPKMYAIVHKSVRRAKLRRFPYLVLYRVHADQVEVLSVMHASRDPQAWQDQI